MESGRGASLRTKVGVMLGLTGLLSGLLAVMGPQAGAVSVPGDPNGTITGFEVEGNQVSDGQGIDWQALAALTPAADGDSLTVVTDDTTDTGLQGSSKENDPSGWTCDSGGANPPKNNILHVAVNTRVSQAGAFVDLGYMREGQTGNAHVNFEFNQNPITSQCPFVGRTTGDLLLLFNFPGGAGQADVAAFLWDSTISSDGEWVSTSLPASAAAAISNPGSTTDYIFPGVTSMLNRQFGEASLNLSAIFGSNSNSCVSFGTLNVRSRSAAGNLDEDSNSISSALQDRLVPTPVDLSTCGRIKIKKVDDAGTALEGAVFGLWPDGVTVPAVGGDDTRPATGSVDTCTSGADGTCVFDDLLPGDYYIAEISAPAGYSLDPDVMGPISVAVLEQVDLTDDPFVDPRDTGSVLITKAVTDGGEPFDVDPADLAGLTFILEQDGVQVDTWPPPGDPAECSLDGVTLSCEIGPVVLGDYVVTEDPDTLPDGMSQGPDVNVTIDEDGETVEATITNPLNPINVNLDKAGPDTANVGDVITYTFDVSTTGEPLTITQLVEIIDLPDNFDDRCDTTALTGPNKSVAVDPDNDGDAVLETGEKWRWTCQHTVTAADATDADGVLLQNKAEVTGEDSFGREVVDHDTHTVTILLPDLAVVKQAADGVDSGTSPSSNETIDAPGTASYTITVTNVGTGIARNATLTDTLPAGSWNVVLTSPDGDDVCPVGGNPKSGSFTCTFGDLAPNASKTVTVSRAVTIANDCAAVLVNNAGVTTTYQTVDIDPNNANDSSSATINVRCTDVGVVKTATNSPINAGDRAEWTITVTNNGAGVASDVHLTDTVASDLSDLVLGGADADDCTLDGHVLTCDFGDIVANDGSPGGPDTRVITISGLTGAADCGTVPNTATVVNSRGGAYVDTNAANNSDSDDVEVQCPDVYVEKSGPAEVSAGDTITWDITFGNQGEGDAYDVTLTDTLPAGLTGYSLTDLDEVCDLSGSTVTCTFEVLEAGAEYEISITGTSGTSLEACGNVVNPVSIAASNEATGTIRDNNTDSATTDVECPDVDLVKVADDPSTVSAGDPVGFSISVANAEGEDVGTARDVVVSDTLPDIPGYTWTFDTVVSEEEDPCSLDGLELTCNFGDLAPGETASVHLVATHDGETAPQASCESYPNTGTVTLTNGTEADRSNNTASVEILCPGVNLNKVEDAAVVEAGDQIGFTITVSNIDDGQPPAEGVAKDVIVIDDLPGDLAWEIAADSDLPEGADCSIDNGTLTCELGDLPAVDAENAPQVTIHIVADTTEADCAVYDNTASATVANGVDPDDADASSRVRCPISIDLVKTGDSLAHVGDVVTYDFAATNTGGEDLLNVELTDPECDSGTIVLVDDGDGDAVLAAGTWNAELQAFVGGEVWTYTCERTLTAADVVIVDGNDVALNTGSVRGEDVDGREATATDPHVVDIITPAIVVVKTVDDENPDVGQTVTFTYLVTNTGDTTLFDVEVVDDQLGVIGTIAELEAGASATLTKTMLVAANSPTRNVAVATGEDVLGKSVTDDDDATIAIVLGEVLTRPDLPRTGSTTRPLLGLSAVLMLFGALLSASGERRVRQVARRHLG